MSFISHLAMVVEKMNHNRITLYKKTNVLIILQVIYNDACPYTFSDQYYMYSGARNYSYNSLLSKDTFKI